MQAIADVVEMDLRSVGVRLLYIEGLQRGQWVLLDYGDLIVLARPGSELEPEALSPALAELLRSGQAVVLADRTVDLSSTELRDRLGRGEEPPLSALSPLVLDYIHKYRLYR